jgi:hypothetical protein
MPKRTLAWASISALLIAAPACGTGDVPPQPISAATNVLKALFNVFGTQAVVVNDNLIRLEGPKRVFFGRVPGSDCKFVEMRPDDQFAGQIDFSHISAEYETSSSCTGISCGIALTLIGQGPAVCWTQRAVYPLSGTAKDFAAGQCFSKVAFPGMNADVARLVLRSVRLIQRTACPPIEMPLQ